MSDKDKPDASSPNTKEAFERVGRHRDACLAALNKLRTAFLDLINGPGSQGTYKARIEVFTQAMTEWYVVRQRINNENVGILIGELCGDTGRASLFLLSGDFLQDVGQYNENRLAPLNNLPDDETCH